ncbi:MAG TPA: hypothetical protein VFX02_11510 [Gammaproteobacteria bacterium]|nr:hypothetical protein [Gammaproteobacteria bacterium]
MNDMEQSEIEFRRRVKEQLDAGISGLDEAALARLRAAREQALAIARAKQRITDNRQPFRLGFAMAAMLVAVMTWRLLPTHWSGSPPGDMTDDLEMLIAEDEVDFYADMEFLIWLEQQDHAS